MTVTAALYAEYEAHKQKAVDYAQATYGTDLSDVKLVIIPAGAGIECGAAGNPAIYLNKVSKPDQIAAKYTNPLNRYKQLHATEVVRTEDIVVPDNAEKEDDDKENGRCVLVKEMASTTAEQKLFLVAVLWHELGHGFNERKPLPNNEQTAYQFEIEMLGADVPWAYLQGLGVTSSDVLTYLMNRYSQYCAGPPPPETTLGRVQDLAKKLCAAEFVGTEMQAPPGQPKFRVPLRGNIFRDTFFTMNLQAAMAQNAAAVQQGVCAVLAANTDGRKKVRPWVWLNLAGQRKLGKDIKLSRYEADNAQTEVQFYAR